MLFPELIFVVSNLDRLRSSWFTMDRLMKCMPGNRKFCSCIYRLQRRMRISIINWYPIFVKGGIRIVTRGIGHDEPITLPLALENSPESFVEPHMATSSSSCLISDAREQRSGADDFDRAVPFPPGRSLRPVRETNLIVWRVTVNRCIGAIPTPELWISTTEFPIFPLPPPQYHSCLSSGTSSSDQRGLPKSWTCSHSCHRVPVISPQCWSLRRLQCLVGFFSPLSRLRWSSSVQTSCGRPPRDLPEEKLFLQIPHSCLSLSRSSRSSIFRDHRSSKMKLITGQSGGFLDLDRVANETGEVMRKTLRREDQEILVHESSW